jgi:peroxin-6
MEVQNGAVNPRKRRRRRRLDRPAISARLLLDDRSKGEVGVLSEDLFDDLFPGSKSSGMYQRASFDSIY